jgi:DNA-binding HxlR family transcriptional regulator
MFGVSIQVSETSASAVDAGFRAGGRVLSVLKNPLNTKVLRAHESGPRRLVEIREEVGWAAASTLRAAVSSLREVGALVRPGDDSGAATALSPAGQEMLRVADAVEAWLALCPKGPIAPDGEGAKMALKALEGGWDSTLMRALAAGPLTLNQLSEAIPQVSYPSLERRIAWMRGTGQVEQLEKNGKGTPYAGTDWLRQAVAPICVAGRCERRHMDRRSSRASSIEVETAFLLAIPLVALHRGATGNCALAVQIVGIDGALGRPSIAGVEVEVERGRVISCTPTIAFAPRTWAVGTSTSWLDAVIDGRTDGLKVGGADPQLALDLACGVNLALFGS